MRFLIQCNRSAIADLSIALFGTMLISVCHVSARSLLHDDLGWKIFREEDLKAQQCSLWWTEVLAPRFIMTLQVADCAGQFQYMIAPLSSLQLPSCKQPFSAGRLGGGNRYTMSIHWMPLSDPYDTIWHGDSMIAWDPCMLWLNAYEISWVY